MRAGRSLSGLLALGAGFATMAAELSAVRLLAPSFGDSAPVWTNVIAVMLVALAIGAWLGGRFADRGAGQRLLPAVFWISAALLALAPYLAPRIAGMLLPAQMPLDLALGAMIQGSLAVGLIVFAPPVLLLGMVSPCLIKMGCADESDVGRASGAVYAAGTIGSLAGTFLATHVLVPGLGLRGSFALYAGVLVICGLLSWLAGSAGASTSASAKRPAGLLLLFVPLLASGSLFVEAPVPAWIADSGYELIEARDSRYQRLWVLEGQETLPARDLGAGPPERRARFLAINEGADSYHSIKIEGEALSNGRYYDAFAMLPAMLGPRESDRPLRVLSLGCATGALLRAVDHAAGGRIEAVGIELDPAVVELGQKWFETPKEDARIQIHGGIGARLYVERIADPEEPFDLILLDAYRHQIYVPPQLASVEFFARVRRLLRPGGLLALNVGELPQGGPVLPRIAGTVASEFGCVESLQLPLQRNALLIAHDGEAGALARRVHAASAPRYLSARLWQHAGRDGAWRSWGALPEDERMTDDWSPLLQLHEELYRSERDAKAQG
jgi:spermidine synthase